MMRLATIPQMYLLRVKCVVRTCETSMFYVSSRNVRYVRTLSENAAWERIARLGRHYLCCLDVVVLSASTSTGGSQQRNRQWLDDILPARPGACLTGPSIAIGTTHRLSAGRHDTLSGIRASR